MPAETLLRRLLPPAEGDIEQVVARYQRVAGAVTRFARTVSGNERLVVRLGTEAAAGGDEVVCDPRTFRAAYARSAPVTPEEVALASALHEVVHLATTNLDEERTLPPGGPFAPSEEPLTVLEAVEATEGPLAEALFFALEDARQERRGLAAYPGARSVLGDLYEAGLADALRSSGPLGQYATGCFLLCGDYVDRRRIEKRVDPRAAHALSDAGEALAAAAAAPDPWTVGEQALVLVAIARTHGLVSPLAPSPGEARARQRAEAEAAREGVDRLRLPTPVLRDAESYRETRRASHARPGLSDRRGPAEIGGDPATDQLVRVSQARTVFLPTGEGGRLLVERLPASFRVFAGEGRTALGRAARAWSVDPRAVSGELLPLFAANHRRGLRSGYDQGDISPHAPLFLGGGLYTRMYERRSTRTRRTYAVSLLVDASASMLQLRPGHLTRDTAWGMSAALLGAWTLARLCEELQVDFEVALFNRSYAARATDTEWSYTRTKNQALAGLRQTHGAAADRLSSTVNHYLVKPFDGRWREAEELLAGAFWTAAEPAHAAAAARRDPRAAPPVSMFERASNVDELNLSFAAERMGRLGSHVRVLVVLADGMTRGSVRSLAATVEAIERSGTTVLGIGIGDDTVAAAYDRSEVVTRPDELARAMLGGVRGALRRGLALTGMDAWWLRPGTSTNGDTAHA